MCGCVGLVWEGRLHAESHARPVDRNTAARCQLHLLHDVRLELCPERDEALDRGERVVAVAPRRGVPGAMLTEERAGQPELEPPHDQLAEVGVRGVAARVWNDGEGIGSGWGLAGRRQGGARVWGSGGGWGG